MLLLAIAGSTGARAQFPNGYWYSGIITIAHSQVPNTDQANFPVVLTGTYADLATTTNGGKVASPNGYDIVFTSDAAGLNKLNFERESYSPATGQVVFWVQVPIVSHATDTVFFIFYGNSSVNTDQSAAAATWDNNYLGVWHLDGNPAGPAPQELDSSSQGNHLTAVGPWSPSNVAAGQIGSALLSSSNDGFTSNSSTLSPSTSMTVSAWISTSIGSGIPSIMAQYLFLGQSAGYYFIVNANTGHMRFKLSAGNNGGSPQTTFDSLAGTVTDGNWHYVVATYNSGANPSIYVDGSVVPAPPTNGNTNQFFGSLSTTTSFLLAPYDGSLEPFHFQGLIDEARISNAARSADWIATEYRNQLNPALFYSVLWGLTNNASTPWLAVSPQNLSFTAGQGPPNPPPQSVAISNLSGGALNWQASADQSWILFSSTSSGSGSPTLSGAGSQTFWIQISAGSLAPGSYSGTITISAPGANSSPQAIHVALIVLATPIWPNGYGYAGTITVAHSQVPNTDQVSFPVLVSGVYPDLATAANSGKLLNPNGYDIIFTSDANGQNKLNYERESYSSATGQVAYWVQVPLLSHTTDTVIYVFYSNSAVTTDQSNAPAVWDSNYQGVWHLGNGVSLTAHDSTSQGNNGQITGATAAAGEVGGGASLNGNAWVNMGSNRASLHSATGLTVESWVKPTSAAQNNYAGIILQDYSNPRGAPWVSYKLGLNYANHGTYEFELTTTAGADTMLDSGIGMAAGAWAHVVGTWDGSTKRIYVNGALKGSAAQGGTISYSPTGMFQLGANSSDGEQLTGLVDEGRISNIARSADWIATEYNNQSSLSAFYTAVLGLTSGPALSVSPSNLTFNATSGGANPAAQSVVISSLNSIALGNWTVSSNNSWITLSLTPTGAGQASLSGTGEATIYVQVGIGTLPAGGATTNGSLLIRAAGANPSQIPVSVAATVTSAPPSGTWPNGYSYAGTLTISHGKVPNTDQSNFPVLISGTYLDLATTANGGKVTNPNGYDIVFTSDANGQNKLNFERESYSPTTGQVAYWVQVPLLSHTTDTVIYVFYGNSAVTTDQSNTNAVWDSNYQGVWHLGNGVTLTAQDSTSQGNNGQITGATSVAGEVGAGASLNGNSWVNMGANRASLHPATGLTVETWVKPTSAAQNNYAGIVLQDYSNPRGSPWVSYKLGLNHANAGAYEFELSTSGGADTVLSSGVPFVNGTWAHVVGTWDGSTKRIYVNGVLKGSAALGGTIGYSATGLFQLGANSSDTEQLTGVVDEARVSNIARSADWIAAEYNNQTSPSTFYTAVLGLTSGGTPPAPALSVSPTVLTFNATSGGANPTAQSVALSSSNSTALGSWTASSSNSWITLSTTPTATGQPSLNGTGAATIYVQVAIGSLGVGTNNGSLSISATGTTGSPQGVSVAAVISSGTSGSTWPNGYSYAGILTVSHAQVPNTDQSNFPVLVSGTYSDLATTVNGGKVTSPNGYDIIFTSDANGQTKLNFERESYSPTTGQVAYWVQAPLLSHTTDTVIYVFYGNAAVSVDPSTPAGTWDSNYQGVWHLGNGISLSAQDSTSQGNNGQINGATATAGEVGGGANLNGNAWVSMGANAASLHPANGLTVECWVKPTSASQNNYAGMVLQDYSNPRGSPWVSYKLGLNYLNRGTYEFELSTTSAGDTMLDSGVAFAAGTWAHVVGTWDGSTKRIYVNGVMKGSAGQTGTISYGSTGMFAFGANSAGAEQATVVVDEGRVSNIARSPDWIATEYNNQSSPATFYSPVWGQTHP